MQTRDKLCINTSACTHMHVCTCVQSGMQTIEVGATQLAPALECKDGVDLQSHLHNRGSNLNCLH